MIRAPGVEVQGRGIKSCIRRVIFGNFFLEFGTKCQITGTNITIEYFSTDEEREIRFKELRIKTTDDIEKRLPTKFRTREILIRKIK